MSSVIRWEAAIFFLSAVHGMLLCVVYDLFRALRRVIPHAAGMVSLEDFLYWIMACLLTFGFAFVRTDGVIRGYVIVGMLLGAVLYYAVFGSRVVGILAWMFGLVKRLIAAIWYVLSKPVKKLWQIWQKMIEFTHKKGYNAIKMRGNRPKDGSGEDICETRCE